MRARLLVAAADTALAFVAALGIALPSAARAEPRAAPTIEASGFVGVDWFGGAHSELGNSWAPEQVPGTSAVIGGRIGWLALPDLLPGDLQLAIEGELAVAPAHTGHSVAHHRMRYFAPVFEWRSQAVLQLVHWRGIAPHLVLGVGGDTVASNSPFMSRDTDPIAYWGPGLSAPIAGSWLVRLDLHLGVMPARSGGVTSTMELEFGIGTTFGSAPAIRREPPPVPPAADDAALVRDRDGDGIPDRLDACPDQPGPPQSAAGNGCPEPEPDPDGDGIVGQADRCPDQPEDQDGWEDEDGCPDELPSDVAGQLAMTVRFAPGHARITRAAGKALEGMRGMLERRPELRLAIIGHPERAGGEDLARRRTEAVKWYLVDQGIPEDRIVTRVAAVPSALAVVFQLAPARR
ncbi:MAG TPA: OmpA family protein [Kofleriaceae bacterium]